MIPGTYVSTLYDLASLTGQVIPEGSKGHTLPPRLDLGEHPRTFRVRFESGDVADWVMDEDVAPCE